MKHDHPRLPSEENKTRVGVYSVQTTKICTFRKDDKCMDPRAFCTSQMCVQIERLLQQVTNGEGFCQDLAIGIARARFNQKVFAVSYRDPRAVDITADLTRVRFLEFYQMRSQSGQKSGIRGGCLNHPEPPSRWPSSQYTWRQERSTA